MCMSKLTVDARGLSCPQPVLMAMKAVKSEAAAFDIIVDNRTALNKGTRDLKSTGKITNTEENEGCFVIEVQ